MNAAADSSACTPAPFRIAPTRERDEREHDAKNAEQVHGLLPQSARRQGGEPAAQADQRLAMQLADARFN